MKSHQHYWLTGEAAVIKDPDGGKWFITRFFAFPKNDDNADSCHNGIMLEQAQET